MAPFILLVLFSLIFIKIEGSIVGDAEEPAKSRKHRKQTNYLSKMRLVETAEKLFNRSHDIECSRSYDLRKQNSLSSNPYHPYYTEKVLAQYSGLRCDGPLTVSRLGKFISTLADHSDGSNVAQCPEVQEWYSKIANSLPRDSNFCETGFAEGHTSALFLLEGYRKNVTIHSFDMNPGNVKVKQLFGSLFGPERFKFYLGNIADTIPKFFESGGYCDVILMDASTPVLELSLFHSSLRKSSNPRPLLIYHWHVRGESSRDFFHKFIAEGKLIEKQCMLVDCSLTIHKSVPRIVREVCLGGFLWP